VTASDALGYVVMGVSHGDAHRKVARFTCARCPETIDITGKPGSKISPDFVTKLAIRAGWHADCFRKSRALCPTCIKGAPKTNPEPKEPPMSTTTQAKPPSTIPTPLTSDQRLRIRGLLDEHFDDKAGMYLANMTDAKLAEQVNVARVHVEQIREAAYGPIRINPEITGLRNEIVQVKREIETHQAAVDALRAKVVGIEQRVAKVAA
jgi:hypothetical protein